MADGAPGGAADGTPRTRDGADPGHRSNRRRDRSVADRLGRVDLLQPRPLPQPDELPATVHLCRRPQRPAAVHPARLRGRGTAPRAGARAVLGHAVPGPKPAGNPMRRDTMTRVVANGRPALDSAWGARLVRGLATQSRRLVAIGGRPALMA